MFKKIVSIVFITLIIATSSVFSVSASTTLEICDFRTSNWGMTQEAVKNQVETQAQETAKIHETFSSLDLSEGQQPPIVTTDYLYYGDAKILTYASGLYYNFKNGLFVSACNVVSQPYDYQSILNDYVSRYGPSIYVGTVPQYSEWKTRNTKISLSEVTTLENIKQVQILFTPIIDPTLPNKPTISYLEYSIISNGMSQERVAKIIGGYGEKTAEAGTGEYRAAVYSYTGEGSRGANAVLEFQGDKLICKAQYGLK